MALLRACSVTAGVISRVDMQQYSHSNCTLLTIQLDAAINSGNSGGPAFHNGQVRSKAYMNAAAAAAA